MIVTSEKEQLIDRINSSEIWMLPIDERLELIKNNDTRILKVIDLIAKYLITYYKNDDVWADDTKDAGYSDSVNGEEILKIINYVVEKYTYGYKSEEGEKHPPIHMIHYLCKKRQSHESIKQQREMYPYKLPKGVSIQIKKIYAFCEREQISIEKIGDGSLSIIAEQINISVKKTRELLKIAFIVNTSSSIDEIIGDDKGFSINSSISDKIAEAEFNAFADENMVISMIIANIIVVKNSKKRNWNMFFSHTIICSIRLENLLAELLPVENDCWPVMNAEYVLFVVENADTFYTIQSNRLLKQLQDKTMAEFCGCSKENISIGLKEYRRTMGNVLRIKEE